MLTSAEMAWLRGMGKTGPKAADEIERLQRLLGECYDMIVFDKTDSFRLLVNRLEPYSFRATVQQEAK